MVIFLFTNTFSMRFYDFIVFFYSLDGGCEVIKDRFIAFYFTFTALMLVLDENNIKEHFANADIYFINLP